MTRQQKVNDLRKQHHDTFVYGMKWSMFTGRGRFTLAWWIAIHCSPICNKGDAKTSDAKGNRLPKETRHNTEGINM